MSVVDPAADVLCRAFWVRWMLWFVVVEVLLGASFLVAQHYVIKHAILAANAQIERTRP